MKKIASQYKFSQSADAEVMEALRLLTGAYIQECGISLGYRTVVYNVAEEWQERLAWMDLPLSEMARKEPFVNLMPYISDEYIPERYDKYDIIGMSDEEMIDCCREIVEEQEFDKNTIDVLCWGIQHRINREKFQPVMIDATAPDGTYLKGMLLHQCLARTSIMMLGPFKDTLLRVEELERDPKRLLIQGYLDYMELLGKEDDIRRLYPTYQKELEKAIVAGESTWKRMNIFRNVYGGLIGKLTLSDISEILESRFGLKFFRLF